MLTGMLAQLRKMRRRRDGTSTVELAFVMAFFGPTLLLGTTELSIYVYASVELVDATHAAASYAAQYYYESSNSVLPGNSQVTNAATIDSPDLTTWLKPGTTFSATVATGCGTAAPTNGSTVPTCTTGNLPYVQVTSTATISPIVKFFSSPAITMTSQARVNLVK
jgi:Flp pilus assembly protein TadG